MKKNIIFIMTLLSLSVVGQNVSIPDGNFKSYLVGNTSINTNNDSEIQVSEAQSFTGSINCSGMSITTLTGIEEFTEIVSLTCNANSLSSLDVSENTKLTYLSCINNSITSLDVSSNPDLSYLYCQANSITSLDLSDNINLVHLECGANSISSIDFGNVATLVTIKCEDNDLTDMDLSSFTNLTEFRCGSNNLTSLDLSQNSYLDLLNCGWNSLTSLTLPTNSSLQHLTCNQNQLTSLDLTNQLLLAELDCGTNPITSLDLNHLSNLKFLRCMTNALTTLKVANGNNYNFTTFRATNNPDLKCIEVDDPIWSTTVWQYIDATASFSESCCSIDLTTGETQNGDDYVLGANEMNATSYQWIDCDSLNQPIAGANSGTLIVSKNGNYACIIQIDSCIDTTNCIAVTHFDTTSITGIQGYEKMDIVLYPNPVQSILNISSSIPLHSVKVLDLTGQKLISTRETRIDVSNLSMGIYIISMQLEDKVINKRFYKL